MEYKPPLTIKEQIKYLEDNKRVIYNQLSKDKAEEILRTCNYINVISPFKHRFAKKDRKQRVQKDVYGNHIYTRDVDFKEYYDLYVFERNQYPIMYKNLMNFERLLNSIVSHESIYNFYLSSTEAFNIFIEMLKANINTSAYLGNKKDRIIETINKLNRYIEEYQSPYIVFDNLCLNEILAILTALDKKTQDSCINQIICRQNIIKANDIPTFYDQASKLVRIRNCICHNDSLEILLRYLSRKHKRLRTSSDKHSYAKLIKKLNEQ